MPKRYWATPPQWRLSRLPEGKSPSTKISAGSSCHSYVPEAGGRWRMSRQAVQLWRSHIERVLESRPHEIVLLEDAVVQGRDEIDVAFISRDITGLSTKPPMTLGSAPSMPATTTSTRASRMRGSASWAAFLSPEITSQPAARTAADQSTTQPALATGSSQTNAEADGAGKSGKVAAYVTDSRGLVVHGSGGEWHLHG